MKVEHEIELTPEQLAEAFCELDDDSMAKFFEAVGKRAERWRAEEKGSYGADWMWWSVGRHMRTCSCVSELGRSVVDGIHGAMHYQEKT